MEDSIQKLRPAEYLLSLIVPPVVAFIPAFESLRLLEVSTGPPYVQRASTTCHNAPTSSSQASGEFTRLSVLALLRIFCWHKVQEAHIFR